MNCKDQKQKKILNFPARPLKSPKISHVSDKKKFLSPNKNLGQNFLSDPQICDQVALSAGNLSSKLVIEIGPGMGHLTRAIAILHPGVEIIGIEVDKRFIPILDQIASYNNSCKIQMIEGDALQFDFQSLVEKNDKKAIKIIANLPYNIGTELLFMWLNVDFLSHIESISVMLQKEVVNRIIASNKSKAYCWLSILSQLLCDVDLLFDVPKESFFPQPKVVSSVVSLVPKQKVIEHNIKKLKTICHELFLHRRKTVMSIIKNSNELSHLLPYMSREMLAGRPEDLDIATLCRLSLV
jgi:16S rRNA (adenine1518-N6/adenine1519-N6)-dimethyltransferase